MEGGGRARASGVAKKKGQKEGEEGGLVKSLLDDKSM